MSSNAQGNAGSEPQLLTGLCCAVSPVAAHLGSQQSALRLLHRCIKPGTEERVGGHVMLGSSKQHGRHGTRNYQHCLPVVQPSPKGLVNEEDVVVNRLGHAHHAAGRRWYRQVLSMRSQCTCGSHSNADRKTMRAT